jgi:hypothetical protein
LAQLVYARTNFQTHPNFDTNDGIEFTKVKKKKILKQFISTKQTFYLFLPPLSS